MTLCRMWMWYLRCCSFVLFTFENVELRDTETKVYGMDYDQHMNSQMRAHDSTIYLCVEIVCIGILRDKL